MKDDVIGFLGLVALVLLLIVYFSENSHGDQFINYSRSCDQQVTVAEKCTKWNPPVQEIYYVNVNAQRVMFTGDYGPVQFTNCTVVDNKNWQCANGLSAKEGTEINNSISAQMYAEENLGFFRYWYLKLF